MAKLIMYKSNFFWLRVVNFDKYDMEFEIYNLGGQCMGAQFTESKTRLISSLAKKVYELGGNRGS